MENTKKVTELNNDNEKYLMGKTPKALPENPTSQGMSAERLKKYFYDGFSILFNWLKQTQSETNTALSNSDDDINGLSSALANLITSLDNGTKIVKKAQCDKNGNDIVETYQIKAGMNEYYTKSEVDNIEQSLIDQITDLSDDVYATTDELEQAVSVLNLSKLNISDVDNSFSYESTHPLQNKVVTEKIEEVEDIAKGAQRIVSFRNYLAMITSLKSLDEHFYRKGQSIYIATLEVPDLWVYDNEANYNDYTYVDDDTFVNTLKNNGSITIGYFTLCALETQKVDLTDYYTKAQVDARDNAKLDKITTATTNAQVYVKEPNGSQGVRNISNEAVANTLTLRDSHGNLIANNTLAMTILADNTDLNSVVTLGIYQLWSGRTYINNPLNDGTTVLGYNAILKIERTVSSGTTQLIQILMTNHLGEYFIRYSTNNELSWGNWYCLATTDYVDNAIAAAITTAINDNY